jgi:prepilin-type N-terminal cleavage/methylation domain-containing protein
MLTGGGRRGFTLVELLIVIAILAILFTIAMAGYMTIRRSSNEKAAGASLKTVNSAQETFRNSDLERNGVSDYWTGDLAGLYAIAEVAGGARPIASLNDAPMASADAAAMAPGAYNNGTYQHGGIPLSAAPKSGYWFQAELRDVNGNALMVDTDGFGAVHNVGTYAFCAVPSAYGATGSFCLILNQGNAIFRRDLGGSTPVVPNPPARFSSVELDQWPTSAQLSADWGKVE